MKWPRYLLAHVKCSSNKVRRARIETLRFRLRLRERWRGIRDTGKRMNGQSDGEPHWAEELQRCVLWLLSLDRRDAREVVWCGWISCCPSTAHIRHVNLPFPDSSPHRSPPLMILFSAVEEGHTSFIQILSRVCFAHLRYIAGPACRMTQGLLILWKEKKRAPISEKHIQTDGKQTLSDLCSRSARSVRTYVCMPH